MPTFVFQNVNITHVVLTVSLGLAFVIFVAWQQRESSWQIDTFFLAGRNIGAPLTAQAYWGSSFSFANGIIYFAALGYAYGLSVVWFQLPWVVGIWVLAWRLPQLIQITNTYTLHGFLGSLYGPHVRMISSIVTITGFLGFFAYEVAISTDVVSTVLNLNRGVTIIAFMVAIYVAAHADVGGYSGTARTDRIQNVLGMIVVILIVYYLVAFPNNGVSKSEFTPSKLASSFLDITSIPWSVWLGVLCFAPFVNIVDMSHWQSIAANSEARTEAPLRAFRLAIIKSGCWMIVFPALSGAFLGYAWRNVSGITDANLLPVTIANSPGASGEVAGFIGGFIILGLLAVGFSSASGYLLASVQTASWDLRHYDQLFEKNNERPTPDQEEAIVLEARLILYILAALSIVLFAIARHVAGDDRILPLQFTLVGIIVSLFPATGYGLYVHASNASVSVAASKWMFISIATGFFAGLAVYFKSLLFGGNLNDVYQWAPVASLAVSSAVALIAIALDRRGYLKGKLDSKVVPSEGISI